MPVSQPALQELIALADRIRDLPDGDREQAVRWAFIRVAQQLTADGVLPRDGMWNVTANVPGRRN